MTAGDSTFTGNTAGIRGGAINNYLGTQSLTGSSLIGNVSTGNGGALEIVDDPALDVSLPKGTPANNTAGGHGGQHSPGDRTERQDQAQEYARGLRQSEPLR